MDRFIVTELAHDSDTWRNLKSNMDRFIVIQAVLRRYVKLHLKSNMDRFIALNEDSFSLCVVSFKIQYG